jgi:hypothetical protein
MRTLGFCLLLGVSGLALTWLSGQVGWWWVTPLVGVLIGLLLRPAWLALVTSLAAGGLGWGLPLALLAFTAPVGRLAAAVEAVFRLPATGGTIIILLTVVFGCVLSLVGTWVGIAGRNLPGFQAKPSPVHGEMEK